MQVTVQLFASLRERVGTDELVVEVPDGATVNELLGTIAEDHPDVARPEMVVAVDRRVVDRDEVVPGDAEVAVYPPVSGGVDSGIVDGPVELSDLVDRVRTDDCGAVATFTGVVRGTTDGEAVERLDYEVYDAMADDSLASLAERAEQRFEIEAAVVIHRKGRFEVGEPVVHVAVGAAHRGPAFEACEWLIDTLKEETPIWKKEHRASGETWVEDHA